MRAPPGRDGVETFTGFREAGPQFQVVICATCPDHYSVLKQFGLHDKPHQILPRLWRNRQKRRATRKVVAPCERELATQP
jgi:hypothetical protein